MDKKVRKVPKTKEGVPKKYLPKGLSESDRKKQLESIRKGTDRPKLKSAPPPKRSSHVVKFEKRYGVKITNKKFINDNLLSYKGQNEILKKGAGAYRTGGSRPNVSETQWKLARLASALTGGKSATIDKSILKKYGKGVIKKKYG
tara:strand:- start:4780 stop:5214 length:435 start_codon:yes stop_codon:yes gene_type:complete